MKLPLQGRIRIHIFVIRILGSGYGAGSGSIFFYTDPRIRIRTKIIWIRNPDLYRCLSRMNQKLLIVPGIDAMLFLLFKLFSDCD